MPPPPPFKSEAQRRKFHALAQRGEISRGTVEKWEEETPSGEKLPERVEKKRSKATSPKRGKSVLRKFKKR